MPVVQETGGLADTIVDASDAAVAADTANGFSFREDNALALSETLRRGVRRLRASPRGLAAIDGNRDASGLVLATYADEYIALYEKIRALR